MNHGWGQQYVIDMYTCTYYTLYYCKMLLTLISITIIKIIINIFTNNIYIKEITYYNLLIIIIYFQNLKSFLILINIILMNLSPIIHHVLIIVFEMIFFKNVLKKSSNI